MKIMVVGGGGREHAVIKALKKNPEVSEIVALPGNGGIAADAVCVPVGATDLEGLVKYACENGVDFAGVPLTCWKRQGSPASAQTKTPLFWKAARFSRRT